MNEDVELAVLHPRDPSVLNLRDREVVVLAAHKSVDLVKLQPEALRFAHRLEVVGD